MSHVTTRDEGLRAAISQIGSICELARKIGLAQPTVSAWKRIPAHHVIRIEAITGISRRLLRPDLYDVPEIHRRPAVVRQAVRSVSPRVST